MSPLSSLAWRQIETAPRDGTAILAWCPGYWRKPEPMVISWFIEVSRDGRRDMGWHYGKEQLAPNEQPTYWMPLPEPPV